jgi:hydrogenase-4 component B
LFKGLVGGHLVSVLSFLFSIFGLVIIGGLALLCFTKAFGSVFLGNSRDQSSIQPTEANIGKLIPMYMAMGLIVSIGLFPVFFLQYLAGPIKLYTDKLFFTTDVLQPVFDIAYIMKYIGWCALGFISLSGIIFLVRKKIVTNKSVAYTATWGCGYVGNTTKMQYTASSFVRTYRKLAEPLLSIHKEKKEIKNIFPKYGGHEIHPYDKIEKWLIDIPLKQIKYIFGMFRFLQNGNPQYYVLYGIAFITLIIGMPFLFDAVKLLIHFLNQL